MRRENIALHEAIKQSDPQELVNRIIGTLERLRCQLDDAIGNQNSLIDMIEAWNDETEGRFGQKYAALNKAVSLASLTLGAKNLAMAAKMLIDPSAGKRVGKKEQQLARATDLSSSGRFASMPPPAKLAPATARDSKNGA